MATAHRRQRLDGERRAELILDEALRLFATRHHTTVTMREIAKSCGINAGLIYYYFASKEVLLHKALSYATQKLMAGYAAHQPERLAPMAALSAWLEVNAKEAALLQLFVKVMSDYASAGGHDEEIDRAIRDFYSYEHDVIEGLLRRGIADGAFRTLDATTTARFISLHLDGIFHAAASRRDGQLIGDIAELDRFLRSYLAPPAGAPKTSARRAVAKPKR